jgi:signal transduction histidine kinase/CheY-like chemotaxis protein
MQLTESSQASGIDGDADLRLQTEQVMMFGRLSHVALVGAIFAGLFVCFLLLREQSPYKVAAWFTLLAAITMLRIFHQKRFLSGRVEITRALISQLLIIIACNGVVWSLPNTWLMPLDPANQVILSLFMVGISANSLISLTPMRYAYSVFLAAMMLPIALQFFLMGENYATSAIGIVAYTIFMISGGRRQTEGTENLLRLQLDNATLAANIQREKEVVERANRDLQQQIEQRERTEAALRASKAEAESASRAKSQFLANMSHELRTPLNGILGTSELLTRSLPNMGQLTKHLKYTQTIHGAGERLLHLIGDILDMARIEAGALRLEHSSFAPRDLVNEVVELTAKQCSDKGLKLAISVSQQVPTLLRGDENRLRQVLGNLIANAVKFTERGGIDVRIEVVAPSDGGANTQEVNATPQVALRWSVIDTGIGIAELARPLLFQPFSQIDESHTRRFGGSGLGLAICHQLVRAMGGRIDVESSPQRGSTFWFELAFDIPSTHVPISVSQSISSGSLVGRVLIAEDNVTNAQLVMEMLELTGCTAVVAHNGHEALEQLRNSSFDLVLMDWHMPELDGVAATKAWREIERERANAKRIPIVALTASVLSGDRETCINAGMDDFLGKPFSYDELFAVVQDWLPQVSAPQPSSSDSGEPV